jgi:hypothetical protein
MMIGWWVCGTITELGFKKWKNKKITILKIEGTTNLLLPQYLLIP